MYLSHFLNQAKEAPALGMAEKPVQIKPRQKPGLLLMDRGCFLIWCFLPSLVLMFFWDRTKGLLHTELHLQHPTHS
jgi:hypothetical protein